MCLLCLFVAESSAQVWNVWVNEYEPNSAEKLLLTPTPEIQQQFTEFLQLPNTGLIRMYPPGRRRVISVEDLATGRRPGFGRYASLYSFTKARHGNVLSGYVDPRLGWAELLLLSGRFFTGFNGEALGVLVALGDVPLETVTPDTDGVTGPNQYHAAGRLLRSGKFEQTESCRLRVGQIQIWLIASSCGKHDLRAAIDEQQARGYLSRLSRRERRRERQLDARLAQAQGVPETKVEKTQ